MIGKLISPILVEIEETLWENENESTSPPEFTNEGFRASVKIFMATIMDKMWALQEKENIDIEIRKAMATKAGNDIVNLVNVYTGINTHSLYNTKSNE